MVVRCLHGRRTTTVSASPEVEGPVKRTESRMAGPVVGHPDSKPSPNADTQVRTGRSLQKPYKNPHENPDKLDLGPPLAK